MKVTIIQGSGDTEKRTEFRLVREVRVLPTNGRIDYRLDDGPGGLRVRVDADLLVVPQASNSVILETDS